MVILSGRIFIWPTSWPPNGMRFFALLSGRLKLFYTAIFRSKFIQVHSAAIRAYANFDLWEYIWPTSWPPNWMRFFVSLLGRLELFYTKKFRSKFIHVHIAAIRRNVIFDPSFDREGGVKSLRWHASPILTLTIALRWYQNFASKPVWSW